MDAPNFIAQAIARAGFKGIFACPGVPITETLTALRLHKQCIVTICRNEQQAANAAAAYGYYSGTHTYTPYHKELESLFELTGSKNLVTLTRSSIHTISSPALCFSTSGPAFMNGLGGVSTAHVNSWPMIFLASSSGNVNTNYFGTFMEYPQMRIAENLVAEGILKAAFYVRTPIELYISLLKARDASLSGQPGPVYLDIDHQVFRCSAQNLIDEAYMAMNTQPFPLPIPRVQPGSLDQLHHSLAKCERPLIIAGKGLAYSGGEPLTWILSKIGADKFPVPILTSPMGKGIILESDSRNASAARKLVMQESDFVIALGARLNWMFDPSSGWTDNKSHGVFCCNLAPELPVEIRDKFVNIHGDAMLVLLEIITHYVKSRTVNPSHLDWVAQIKNKAQTAAAKMDEAKKCQDHSPVHFPAGQRRFTGGLKYAQAFTALETRVATNTKTHTSVDDLMSVWLGPDMQAAVTWVAEGAVSMDKSRLFIPGTVAKCRLDAGTFAGMGVGAPFALGIALWRTIWLPIFAKDCSEAGIDSSIVAQMMSRSFVSLVQGDSAFGFSGMEFETVFRYKFPILMTVLDNGGMYAMSDNEPHEESSEVDNCLNRLSSISVCDLTPNFEFAQLARACQGRGMEAQSLKEYKAQLECVDVSMTSNLPMLMHVRIDPMDGSGAGFVHHL